jgi:AcrR family transcriptional regulator
MSVSTQSSAKDRILESAYLLFTQRGIRAVGINEVIARAGVTKATLYNHFASKDELVVAFLGLREQRWWRDWVLAQACELGATPEERLLAIFDLFEEWFRAADFEACSFIGVLVEMGAGHIAGRASISHLANIRAALHDLASEAELLEPERFAWAFQLLMNGSIVSAADGDATAAQRAKAMARVLIEQHRPRRAVA